MHEKIEVGRLHGEKVRVENNRGENRGVQGRKSVRFSFFGARDEQFETFFGHTVVICTTTSGLRFLEMVSSLLPLEVGPDMERIRKEVAAKKKKREEEATEKSSKQLAEQREREEADQRVRDDEPTLYEHFRATAIDFFGLQKRENVGDFSLHQLQYR